MPKGYKNLSEDWKQKIKESNLGKKHNWTEEGREKFHKARKGTHNNPNGEFKKGLIPWNKEKFTRYLVCPVCKKEFKALQGKINGGRKFCSQKCSKIGQNRKATQTRKDKISQKRIAYFDRIGRKKYKRAHHNYDKKYIEWRKKVFVRDGFTCQICRKVGVYLEAHHIKSWAKYPELRHKTDNGITLCKECHKNLCIQK